MNSITLSNLIPISIKPIIIIIFKPVVLIPRILFLKNMKYFSIVKITIIGYRFSIYKILILYRKNY